MKAGLIALTCLCITIAALALGAASRLVWSAPLLQDPPPLPVAQHVDPIARRPRLDNIAARNLFHPNRNTVVDKMLKASSTTPATRELILNGTAQVGGVVCAWIEVRDRGRAVSKHGAYRVGQAVAKTGYIVEQIEARAVRLKNGHRTLTLKLNEKR